MRRFFIILITILSLKAGFGQLRGKVIDSKTSQPLWGAHVSGEAEKTTTNSEGRFYLENSTSKLIVTFVGYTPDTLTIANISTGIVIALTPQAQLIEQIVIRGNLNEFPIMQIPSAVGYITDLEKQNTGTISYTEHLNSIPGIYAHTGTLNTNRITIRGIGSRTPYNTNRIKAYYNGIPLTTGDGNTEIEDISASLIGSVEVLKGSKSALYGSGLGGAIVLNKPGLSNGLHGYGGFSISEYQTSTFDAGIQYLKNGWYITGNYANARSDGWRQNSDYERHNFMLNAGFSGEKSHLDFMLLLIDTRAYIPSSLNEQNFLNSPENAAQNWLEVKGFEDYRKYIAGITYRHVFNDLLSNKTHLFFQIYDGFESRPFNILDDEAFAWGFRNITTLQLSKLKLQAGFESLFEKYGWQIFETLSGEQGSLQNEFAEKRTPFTVFLNGQYNFFEHTILEAGISLNTLKYSLDDQMNNSGNLSGDYKYNMVYSPYFGFNTKLINNLRMYGSVSHGFSAPSVEETLLPEGSINTDLKPETGVNAEIGIRYESKNRRVFADAGFYRLWALNLLVTKRETEDVFYGENAGKTRHTGVEIASKVHLSGTDSKYPVSLNISYNYIRATFTDFEDDDTDYAGNSLPGIPQQNLWLSATVSSRPGFYLMPQFQHTGKQYLNDANEGSNPAFNLIHVKVGYAAMLQKWNIDIAFGVRNLTDTRYASMILVNAPSFGASTPRYYYPGMPRNYFLSLKIGF
jgi:iron complex outermembrane recepter protein